MMRPVLGLIILAVAGSCSTGSDGRATPSTDLADGAITQAIGIDVDLERAADEQASIVVIAKMRRLAKVCPDAEQDCAPVVVYRVMLSTLIDFDELHTADPIELVLTNEGGVEQGMTSRFSASLQAGTHCVVSIAQFFPVAGVPSEEAEGVIARMDTFSVGSGENHCSLENLRILPTQLRESERFDCGAGAFVNLVDRDERLPEELMHIRISSCDFDSVLLQIHDGRVDVSSIGLIPASNTAGFHVVTAPRPRSGTFRLLWVPAGQPDYPGLDYTPIVGSPPYSFPADIGS